jgi:L-lactate dehydrogenase complex protein LldE
MEVILFVGCVVDQFFPETGMNAVKVMERLGFTVRVPGAAGCCGSPAWQHGQEEIACEVASRCITELSGEIPIVVLSSDCRAMFGVHAPQLLHNGSAHHAVKTLQKRVFSFSSWVGQHAQTPMVKLVSNTSRVACHVSCCMQNEGIPQALTSLLTEWGGFTCVDVPQFSVCCGYGGGMYRSNPELSQSMAAQKLQAARAEGVEYIIAEDMGCLMQLRAVAAQQTDLTWKPDRILHLADLIAEGL